MCGGGSFRHGRSNDDCPNGQAPAPSLTNMARTPVTPAQDSDHDHYELVQQLTAALQSIQELRQHMDLPTLDHCLVGNASEYLTQGRELYMQAWELSQGSVSFAEIKRCVQASETAKTIMLSGRGWSGLNNILSARCEDRIRLHDFMQAYVLECVAHNVLLSMTDKASRQHSSTLRGLLQQVNDVAAECFGAMQEQCGRDREFAVSHKALKRFLKGNPGLRSVIYGQDRRVGPWCELFHQLHELDPTGQVNGVELPEFVFLVVRAVLQSDAAREATANKARQAKWAAVQKAAEEACARRAKKAEDEAKKELLELKQVKRAAHRAQQAAAAAASVQDLEKRLTPLQRRLAELADEEHTQLLFSLPVQPRAKSEGRGVRVSEDSKQTKSPSRTRSGAARRRARRESQLLQESAWMGAPGEEKEEQETTSSHPDNEHYELSTGFPQIVRKMHLTQNVSISTTNQLVEPTRRNGSGTKQRPVSCPKRITKLEFDSWDMYLHKTVQDKLGDRMSRLKESPEPFPEGLPRERELRSHREPRWNPDRDVNEFNPRKYAQPKVSPKQAHNQNGQSVQLEEATEAHRIETVDLRTSQRISQARMAAGMSQAALAKSINQREGVITDYENGKAIPSPEILNKIEKTLGAKVRPHKKERSDSEKDGNQITPLAARSAQQERSRSGATVRSWAPAPWASQNTASASMDDCVLKGGAASRVVAELGPLQLVT